MLETTSMREALVRALEHATTHLHTPEPEPSHSPPPPGEPKPTAPPVEDERGPQAPVELPGKSGPPERA